MADTITVVLPYSGSRYYLQVPTSGLLDKVDFKLWGAGGGAGGTDSHSGGNGAGGGFVQGTAQITKGATLEVFVGQGGGGGGGGRSGSGQGPSGRSLASYAGGSGGAAGPAGSSGGGGGGGGASVIRINNSVVAVAGGGGAGGGGGNRGPYPYGYSATGLPSGSQSTHGFNGGNCGSDGGGGGAGGGGFYGGAGGGPNPYYDNGGYAGANGANYFGNVNPLSTGQYGSARVPGGVTDPNYPGSNVGYGGIANSGAGGNGYVILTFYKAAGLHVNDQGVYRRAVPKIKISGTYTNNAKAWVKVDGVWRSVLADPSISFSSDSTGWGS